MKQTVIRRIFGLLLCLLMVFTLVKPATAMASTADRQTSSVLHDDTDVDIPAPDLTEEAEEPSALPEVEEPADEPGEAQAEADERASEEPADEYAEQEPADEPAAAEEAENADALDPQESEEIEENPDLDGDGLLNDDEINVYNTDPNKADTDGDGLLDSEEINETGTDPNKADTDGDGVADGDELALDMDPTVPEDLSEVFQTIGKGTLDGTLYTDNDAVPSIAGFAPFVLFRSVAVTQFDPDSFRSSKAVVGKAIRVTLPEGGNLALMFALTGSVGQPAVFRMNDAGTVRLDAHINGKTLSVSLDESGVYFVADMQALLNSLGLGTAVPQSLPENSYLLDDFHYVTLSAPLTAGSSVDTDGDGVPDSEEITGSYVLDLGDGHAATVYAFRSDPTLPDTDYDGIPDATDSAPNNNVFTGTYKSGNFTVTPSYTMDYRNFFANNAEYNTGIAGFSVWAAQLCYENEDNDVTYTPSATLYDANGSAISKVYRINSLMEAHGMQNVVDYSLGSGYSNDGLTLTKYTDDDMSEVFFGHRKVTYNGETVEVISVYVRGTNGTEEEWSSNFEIGDLYRFNNDIDVASVKQKQQSNADWNRKTNHRGFDVCANRFLNALSLYVEKYVDAEATPVFWFSGHSRGAAIANIMSSYCVDAGNKVFGYTYASPYTTANTEASAAKYDCIFNLVNGDDFVPRLPMPEWGFTRYGRTETYFASTISSSTRSSVLGTSSYSYKSDSDLKALVKKFADMTVNNAGGNDGWIDVYRYHCGHQHADEQLGESRTGCTRTRQWSELIGWGESMFTGWSQRIQRYAYWSSSANGICETPAYAMQVLAELMGNLSLSGGWDYLTTNKLADRYDFEKTSLINYATGITDPHYMENYYLIQYTLLQAGNPDDQFTTLAPYTTTNANGGRPVHEHTYEIVEVLKAPTCTEEGLAHLVCHCSAVNSAWYDDEIKEAVLPALGHDWGTPAWTWDGVTAATATFTCQNDSTHVETVEAESIVRAENGDVVTYTATATFEGETYTDVKTVEIGYYLIGSMTNWEVDETYRFTENTAAAGEYLLNVNLAVGNEIKVVRAEGAAKLGLYPDYGGNYTVDYAHAGGVKVYFRPAGNVWNDFFTGGFFYIRKPHTVMVITDGNGEASVDPTAPDKTATVMFTATPSEGYHFDRVEFYEKTGDGAEDLRAVDLSLTEQNTFIMPDYDVVIKVYFAAHSWSKWSVTAEPTCTEPGVESRTCADCGETEAREIPATGHNWSAPDYDWSEDYTFVVATRVCANDASHVETETVNTTAVTTDATCTAAGSTVYTATFDNPAFTTQTKTVEIEALGHNWGEPTYEWAADNSSVTASRVCANNDEHVETETVNTTYVVTTAPTAEADGVGTYTATFTNPAFETQTKEIVLPKLRTPAFKTLSLVLSGQIGINFFMDLSMLTEEQKAASYVTFDISGNGTITDRVDYDADFKNATNQYYGFTAYVNSIQMADTITATYHYGDGLTVEETYSVKQYIELFEDNMNLFDDETVALIKSLADYGHYVQPFLANVRNWTIGTDYAEMDKFFTEVYDYETVTNAVADFAIVRELGTEVTKINYSLSLDSATGIYVYFTPVTGYNGSIVAKIDGEEVTPEWEENAARYLVEIANISAHELGKTYEVTFETDNSEAVCRVSTMSYVQGVLNAAAYASDTTAKNAVSALYCYYKAADEYKQAH